MRARSLALCLSTLLLALAGCAAATEEPSEEGTSDLTNAGPQCNPLETRATPLADAIPLLEPTGDIPLPSLGPDAEGYFHPPQGYVEGGSFRLATGKAEWVVKPEEIAPRAARGTLRVVQWNVERGNDLNAAVRLMKKINADVWTINESDLYGKNSGGVVVAREIAKALGYSYYTAIEFYELLDARRGTSGNAIISRFPIEHAVSMDLPTLADKGGHDWSVDAAEPRCGSRNAMSARIAVPNGTGGTTAINFVALHTENKSNPDVRKKQYEAVLAQLVTPGEPAIVAGDLNTVSGGEGSSFRDYLAKNVAKRGRAQSLFDCSRADDTPTWSGPNVTSIFLRLRIDWMLVQSGSANAIDCPARSYKVVGNDSASDHKPVVTELAVK